MTESMDHGSDMRLEAVGPMTWITAMGTRERRVLVTVRGTLSLSLDDAAHLAAELLQAVRAAERA